VAGVEDDGVVRGMEHPVHRQGQLDHAQVGTEVAARAGHRADQLGPDVGRQRHELIGAKSTQLGQGAQLG